jgi:hypothetical protein
VITHKQQTHKDPQEVVNALNDHFITIGQRTSDTIPDIAEDRQQHQQQEDVAARSPQFTHKHTTTTEVTKLLNKLTRNKANDIFKIKPTILRDIASFIAPQLRELFNQALDDKYYPDTLKITKVIELYKAKDKTLPSNYRPISLLP